jgi:peptide subunit release factor 1 (eRF1)
MGGLKHAVSELKKEREKTKQEILVYVQEKKQMQDLIKQLSQRKDEVENDVKSNRKAMEDGDRNLTVLKR